MKDPHPMALFRLSVLGPLASRGDLAHGDLKRVIQELASREYDVPGSGLQHIAGSLKLGTVNAAELVRSLLKSDRPSGLTQAIINLGRIPKTIYLLNFIDDETYRRCILVQLNRGEGRHSVSRLICHGQRGEIRKRYREGQEGQLNALGLVTNAVVLWNTLYIEAALKQLKARGATINDNDVARLSPLVYRHINVLGRYTFSLAKPVADGGLRPLNLFDDETPAELRVIFRSIDCHTPAPSDNHPFLTAVVCPLLRTYYLMAYVRFWAEFWKSG